MLERDHIMRQVNLLSQALVRAMGLRSEGRDSEALLELDTALDDLTGSIEPPRPASTGLLDLCIHPDGTLQPFAFDVAAMLATRGEIYLNGGRVDSARADFRDALAIYQSALGTPSAEIPWDVHSRLERLKRYLEDIGGASGRG